jgi:hypothetical protein
MREKSTIKRPDLFGFVPPEPAAVLRSRTTNNPNSRSNQSTAAGRRLNDLIRGFLQEMGNPTNIVAQAAAISAAELTLAAEDARAKLLAGNGDPDQVVRLENLAHRTVRKLGIDGHRGDGKPKPTLADYMRQKSAAKPAYPNKASAI